MAENLVKTNKCFEEYTPFTTNGDNAYIKSSGKSDNLTKIIDDAEIGITIYHIMGVGMDKGYPVNSTAGTGRPWVHVCITKFDEDVALVNIEYDGTAYYASYDGALSSWHTVTATT